MPLITGLILRDPTRNGWTDVFVTVAFWGTMMGLQRRAHRGLTRAIELTAEVRRGEQRLFGILEAMPTGVIVVDPSLRIYYANEAMRVLGGPGLIPGAGPDRAVYPVFMPGTDRAYPPERLPSARATKGESVTDQFEIHTPQGPRLVYAHGAPIRNANGEVEYGVAVLSDVAAHQGGEQRRAMLNAVLRVLTESRTDDALLHTVLATVGSRSGFDMAELWMADEGEVMRRAGSWVRPGEPRLETFDHESGQITFRAGDGIAAGFLRARRTAGGREHGHGGVRAGARRHRIRAADGGGRAGSDRRSDAGYAGALRPRPARRGQRVDRRP